MTDSFGMSPETPVETDLTERLTTYRQVREEIERRILPISTSVDGVSFEFQASLHDLPTSASSAGCCPSCPKG